MTRLRILVVEDHPIGRRGVRSLLETQAGGESPAEAADGREAVALARELQPDIVVMDLCPNRMDATRQTLQESPRSDARVLTMHAPTSFERCG